MSAASTPARRARVGRPVQASRLATVAGRASVAERLAQPSVSAGSGRTASPPRRRGGADPRRRAPRSTSTSSPGSELRLQRRRRCRPAPPAARPSSARSARTSAALGPPIPVDWIVSSSPAGGLARVAPEAAGVVAHLRLLEQLLGEHQGPAGVADEDRVGGDRGGRSERAGIAPDPIRRGAEPATREKRAPADFLQPSKHSLPSPFIPWRRIAKPRPPGRAPAG